MTFKGIRIGYSRESGKPLRYSGPGNLMLIGAARTGKARDILIPALLDWPYSCVVVDPKGELACVTSEWRRRFGEVHFVDPYGQVAKYMGDAARASRYNPLAELDPNSIDFGAQAEKLGDGLIWDEGELHSHFTEGARGLCGGLTMGLVEHAEPHERNLVELRNVIAGEFQNGVDVYDFAKGIIQNSTNQALRQKLRRFTVKGAIKSRSLADIIQTADVQTHFLSDKALADSLSRSDYSASDLKKKVITTYIVLPLNTIDVTGKYFRVTTSSILSRLLAGEKGVPVLIIMDEFFQLGSLKAIQNAMSMSAGLGVQLWPIVQDLSQISALYPKTWETFLANAGVQIFFGPRDQVTSDYVSKKCGEAERRYTSKSVSYQYAAEEQGQSERVKRNPRNVNRAANINVNYGTMRRQLLLPHETCELGDDEMLLFVEGVKGVIRAKRRPYWDEPDFQGQYGKNPYFG
jgi:type IV secretion system protein VirD4